jgi:hypothetical protein
MKADKLNVLILIFISISFAAKSQISVQFEALPSSIEVNLPDPVYAKSIIYDDIDPERQFFHLFLPDTLRSYPLVVYIHVIKGTQASCDLNKWETVVFNNYDGHGSSITLKQIADALGFERGSNFYGGLESIDQLLSDPDLIQYRQDVDMLYHLSEDDPPIFIHSPAREVEPGDNLLHHARHGKAVYEAAIAANVSGVRAYIPALSINTTDNESANDFLIRHLIGTPVKSNIETTTYSR